jgi:hypothetical protein
MHAGAVISSDMTQVMARMAYRWKFLIATPQKPDFGYIIGERESIVKGARMW